MKKPNIYFFSPVENSQPKEKKVLEPKVKKFILNGYISPVGKIVFPAKTVAELGIDFDNTAFKIGMQEGKRKAKSLYLIPTSAEQTDTFQFEKAARSYTLSLPFILKKSGVNFADNKYTFTIQLFDYEGATAFELQLGQEETVPKALYTGKPRGRKPKAQSVEG